MHLAYSQYPSWQPDVGLQKQALAFLAQKVNQFLKDTRPKYTRRPRSARQTLTAALSQRTAATCSMSCSRLLSCAHKKDRSEEHTSELQSRFGISYAVFCLKKNNT